MIVTKNILTRNLLKLLSGCYLAFYQRAQKHEIYQTKPPFPHKH